MINSKVLFMGRYECDKSQKIAESLKELFEDVTLHFFKDRFDSFPKELIDWDGNYIFSFRCPVKTPTNVLKSASNAAINFHPAPPNYRGSGSAALAIYEQATQFGCTAHIMEKEIDTGQILECRRFLIQEDITLQDLWKKTNEFTYLMVMDFIDGISTHGEEFIVKKKINCVNEEWAGPLRKLKEIDCLQKISLETSKEDLYRIIRATDVDDFKPYITLWGCKFVYTK